MQMNQLMYRIRWIKYLLCSLVMILSIAACGQDFRDSVRAKRLKPLVIIAGGTYAASLIALNELWYSDFERQSFAFFNDSQEWQQMDKAGHFFAAFQISHSSTKLLGWAGLEQKKALVWGSITSAILLTPIEVFDGFSAEYGASISDLAANSLGAGLFYLQQSKWGEIRIHPKYYFKRSNFPELRPSLLGSSLTEELIKDYNAQEYWLSVDLSRFTKSVPKWLNISVGYGASGMVSASKANNESMGLNPSRHYFLGLDFDLNEYRGRSKVINTAIFVLNMVRIPAPALELNKGKLKFHIIY